MQCRRLTIHSARPAPKIAGLKLVTLSRTLYARDIQKLILNLDLVYYFPGKIEAVCLEGGTASTAASQRAQQRRAAVMSLFQDNDLDTLGDQDDADVDWDEEQVAEAGYEEPEERFNDAGIPFEPFHMREERAEGYFDRETGDYVRYQRQEEEDAWVDGLPGEVEGKGWQGSLMVHCDCQPRVFLWCYLFWVHFFMDPLNDNFSS